MHDGAWVETMCISAEVVAIRPLMEVRKSLSRSKLRIVILKLQLISRVYLCHVTCLRDNGCAKYYRRVYS